MNESIEIMEYHDCGGVFWLYPVQVALTPPQHDYWDNVTRAGDEISIDENDVWAFLAYFFYKYFDKNLPENNIRVESPHETYTRFEWYLTYNFFTYDQMRKMLREIRYIATLIKRRDVRAVKRAFPKTKYDEYREIDISKNVFENGEYSLEAIATFYSRFAYLVDKRCQRIQNVTYSQ